MGCFHLETNKAIHNMAVRVHPQLLKLSPSFHHTLCSKTVFNILMNETTSNLYISQFERTRATNLQKIIGYYGPKGSA